MKRFLWAIIGGFIGYPAGVLTYMLLFSLDGSGPFMLLVGFGLLIGGPLGFVVGVVVGALTGGPKTKA